MLHEFSRAFLGPWGGVPRHIVLDPEHIDFRYVDWDRRIVKPTRLRFVNVDRAGFDEWLLSLLPDNVDVVGRLALSSFEENADGVLVRFKDAAGAERVVRCANLVGADGARSTVRRALGPTTPARTSRSRITSGSPASCPATSTASTCGGSATRSPTGTSCRKVRSPSSAPSSTRGRSGRGRCRTPCSGRCASGRPSSARAKREACAALYLRTPRDVTPGAGRVLLAGEAGGFMSPTSGEGISYALRSSRLAGQAIAASRPDDAVEAFRALAAP